MTLKTKAALTTEITTNFPTNGTGSITAALLRSTNQDFIDSWADGPNSFITIATASVNFNSGNTDTSISIALPTGFTRYRIQQAIISGASHDLSTATCGIFPAAAGAGTAIVASGTTITLTATAENTNNNMQSLTIVNQSTLSLTTTPLFFRVQTAEGAAATATVTLFIQPIS